MPWIATCVDVMHRGYDHNLWQRMWGRTFTAQWPSDKHTFFADSGGVSIYKLNGFERDRKQQLKQTIKYVMHLQILNKVKIFHERDNFYWSIENTLYFPLLSTSDQLEFRMLLFWNQFIMDDPCPLNSIKARVFPREFNSTLI